MNEDNTSIENISLPEPSLQSLQEEKDNLLQRLSEVLQHNDQLEKGIVYLRSKMEEKNLEQKEGINIVDNLQKQLKTITKEKEDACENIKKLACELQRERQSKLELEGELEAVQNQFDGLKATIQKLKDHACNTSAFAKEAQHTIAVLEADKNQLKQLIDQRTTTLSNLRKELDGVRNIVDQGIESAKELNEQYDQLFAEKMAVDNQLAFAQQDLERQKNDIVKVEILMQNAFDFRSKLEQKISDLEKIVEEKDNHVRQAQQHLAKKVKETALLQEKYEEHNQRIHELQNQLTQAQQGQAEAKNSHSLFQETLNNAEAQIRKWEEKYTRTHDQLLEAETRIKEFKEMEQKFLQMQSQTHTLLSNLGQVFNSNPPTRTLGSALPRFDEPHKERTLQHDIFSKKETTQPIKTSFFE